MDNIRELKFAVLIDADNVPYGKVKLMFEEIAKYGTPTFKRIYADWTKPTVSGWKKLLLENAITPVQQYSYTSGKNSSDSALIIDAMDILYSGKVDGFCIVSSDSDFTRLAVRLREAGMKVIGIGEKKTLNPFITACDKFIYIEILGSEEEEEKEEDEKVNKSVQATKSTTRNKKGGSLNQVNKSVIKLISESIDNLADETNWTFLGELGNYILKKQPDFDPRNYGYPKLLAMIKSINKFDVDERETGVKNVRHIYVKNKN